MWRVQKGENLPEYHFLTCCFTKFLFPVNTNVIKYGGGGVASAAASAVAVTVDKKL